MINILKPDALGNIQALVYYFESIIKFENVSSIKLYEMTNWTRISSLIYEYDVVHGKDKKLIHRKKLLTSISGYYHIFNNQPGIVVLLDVKNDIDDILKKLSIKEIVSFTKKYDRFRIHIGITAYSQEELELGWIDGKTKVMFYEKNNYHVNPTLNGEVIQKMINYSEVSQNVQKNLPNILHECKRMHIDIINGKVEINKKYIKKLLVLVKCFFERKKYIFLRL